MPELPVEAAYNQWTQFTDFPRFMKKVEDVDQLSDEKPADKQTQPRREGTAQCSATEQAANQDEEHREQEGQQDMTVEPATGAGLVAPVRAGWPTSSTPSSTTAL